MLLRLSGSFSRNGRISPLITSLHGTPALFVSMGNPFTPVGIGIFSIPRASSIVVAASSSPARSDLRFSAKRAFSASSYNFLLLKAGLPPSLAPTVPPLGEEKYEPIFHQACLTSSARRSWGAPPPSRSGRPSDPCMSSSIPLPAKLSCREPPPVRLAVGVRSGSVQGEARLRHVHFTEAVALIKMRRVVGKIHEDLVFKFLNGLEKDSACVVEHEALDGEGHVLHSRDHPIPEAKPARHRAHAVHSGDTVHLKLQVRPSAAPGEVQHILFLRQLDMQGRQSRSRASRVSISYLLLSRRLLCVCCSPPHSAVGSAGIVRIHHVWCGSRVVVIVEKLRSLDAGHRLLHWIRELLVSVARRRGLAVQQQQHDADEKGRVERPAAPQAVLQGVSARVNEHYSL
eukprot:scaffold2141_cov282-Pinguiococcus_pyrenoidosus.AAC.26